MSHFLDTHDCICETLLAQRSLYNAIARPPHGSLSKTESIATRRDCINLSPVSSVRATNVSAVLGNPWSPIPSADKLIPIRSVMLWLSFGALVSFCLLASLLLTFRRNKQE